MVSAPVATRVAVDGGRDGAKRDRRGGVHDHRARGIVEAGLRVIGLTGNFGRFVVLCGHGSESDNNPYFGALHCGACGGKHGDANARAFADDGQSRGGSGGAEVNAAWRFPRTWFLAAKHITTSDRVEFYDLDDVPASHRQELAAWPTTSSAPAPRRRSSAAGACPRRGGGSPHGAWRHVRARTVDWANTRPEWGLASNAAFIIGRRSLTQGVNLQGRAFLHSYHPDHDPEGAILERIMTAPLIVGQWINMEHYFSASTRGSGAAAARSSTTWSPASGSCPAARATSRPASRSRRSTTAPGTTMSRCAC